MLALLGAQVPGAGAASPCTELFSKLIDGEDAVLVQFRKTGLKGLGRAGLLHLESTLQATRVANYTDRSLLKSDIFAYYEIQCLKYQSSCKELTTWWSKNSGQFLENPRYLELFGKPSLTLREIAELASSQYYLQFGKTKGRAWQDRFAWMFSPRAIVATVGAIGASAVVKVFATIYNAATLGTMMKLWNSYTDAAVAPLEAYLKQAGSVQFAGLSKDLQEWLIHRGHLIQELQDLKSRSTQAESKISGAGEGSPEARQLWEEFQSYFYGKFMAFNQSLPGNMRDGRAFVYAAEFSEPLSIANFISTRNESYRAGQRLVRELEAKVASGSASSSDRADLEDQKKYLEIQKKQIAAGLAVFLIRKYMYRDDIYRPVFQKDQQLLIQMDQIQHDLIDALGLQYFLKEYFSQLKDVFRQYELVFQAADLQAQQEISAIQKASEKGKQTQ